MLLKYATNASGAWVLTSVDTYGYVGDRDSSVAVNSSARAFISYRSGYDGSLNYATNSSGSWVISTIDSVEYAAGSPSIALDSNDKVYISYWYYPNSDLTLITNVSGSWVKTTIDSNGNVGYASSIAFDSNNKVYISYYDLSNGNLKHATNAYDSTPPLGSVTINASANFTKNNNVTLTPSCIDPISESCISMQFSNDNIDWSTPEAYATTKTWTLSSGDGTKTVYARFSDAAGNWSGAYSDTIVLDTIAPTTTASPAGGTYTSAQDVTLSCSDGTGSGCANTLYCFGAACTPATPYSGAINISSSDTLRFSSTDNAGNTESVKTETYTLNLDTTPPEGTITINAGATYASSTAATLTLTCTDSESGCSQMQFSNNDIDWSTPEAYAATKAWTLSSGDGTKTVYVKFSDAAGNWSDAYSDTIALDTTSPSAVTLSGNLVTSDASTGRIDIAWTPSTDEGSGIDRYEVYDSVTHALVASTTATSYSFPSLPTLPTYNYYVKAFDSAGNESAPSNILQTTVLPCFSQPLFVDFEQNNDTASSVFSPPRNIVPSPQYFGYIDNATDEDWYQVYAYAGQTIELGITVESTGTELGWAAIAPGGIVGYQATGLGTSVLSDSFSYVVPPGGDGYYSMRIWNANGGSIQTRYDADVKVTPQSDTICPSPVINLTATPVSGTAIDLSWDASTDDYGPVGYGIGDINTNTFFGFSRTNSFRVENLTPNTTYTFGVGAFDGGGNISGGAAITVTTSGDTTPPTGTITINAGADYTNSTSATLTLICSDDETGCSQMQFSNDNIDWSTPEAYAATKAWTLSSGDGTKTVYVKFSDAAGNWSGAYSDTIVLDTLSPITALSTLTANEDWVKTYNGSANGNDDISAMAIDSIGNIYVTGYSTGVGTYTDFTTIKYDSNGNELWVRTYNGPANDNDRASAMAIDSIGNIYVTGYSTGVGTYTDFTTIKYDSNGNELWVRTYNGPANYFDSPAALTLDNNGNVYVTGICGAVNDNIDYATIKYDSNGNQLWIKTYNGPGNGEDKAHALVVDQAGNVYVTGYSTGGGLGIEYLDYATIKYDTNGNELWIRRYDGTGGQMDDASAISIDLYGNIYVTGRSKGIGTDFDITTHSCPVKIERLEGVPPCSFSAYRASGSKYQ